MTKGLWRPLPCARSWRGTKDTSPEDVRPPWDRGRSWRCVGLSTCWTHSHWQGEGQSGLLPGGGAIPGCSSAFSALHSLWPLRASPHTLPSRIPLLRGSLRHGPDPQPPRLQGGPGTPRAGGQEGAGLCSAAPPRASQAPAPTSGDPARGRTARAAHVGPRRAASGRRRGSRGPGPTPPGASGPPRAGRGRDSSR